MDSNHSLLLEPNEFIVFEYLPNNSVTSLVHLKNPSSCNLAFKLKTNSPSSYIVRPTQGILGPYDERCISVSLQGSESGPDPEKDKFLILYTRTAFPTTYPMAELTKYWLKTDIRSLKKAQLGVKLEVVRSNSIQHLVDYTESTSGSKEEEEGSRRKEGEKKSVSEVVKFELKFPDLSKFNLRLWTFVSLVVGGFFYCIT